jgi:prepilin-type N-terminal cleavage/methylation domain-containing protein
MPPRNSRRPAQRGFSLIEAVIVIAIMAILAGAMVPLAMKAINQSREAQTRTNLKAAYEAMFGARDRRVPNMRADFGFTPAGNLPNLGKMITSTAAPAPNPPTTYGLNNGTYFSWGWNGPYWTGPTNLVGGVQVPVDGWGRPIQLRLVNLVPGPGVGFQVFSLGANGVPDTPAGQAQPLKDDLVYPSQPAPLASAYSSSLAITILNKQANPINGTLTITYRSGGPLPGTSNTPITALAANLPKVYNPPAFPSGPMQVVITIPGAPTITFQEVVDLMPGESHAFSYTIY